MKSTAPEKNESQLIDHAVRMRLKKERAERGLKLIAERHGAPRLSAEQAQEVAQETLDDMAAIK